MATLCEAIGLLPDLWLRLSSERVDFCALNSLIR
jgi:hypothetical protein